MENEKAGLTIMGMSYADIALKKKDGKWFCLNLKQMIQALRILIGLGWMC
ncbi:MAG TPA: hypothetical protein VIJ75_10285 [Hanamia sp.]